MWCPTCKHVELIEGVNLGSVAVNTCASCGGIWFDEDELRQVKDEEAVNAVWLDVDLWKDPTAFGSTEGDRLCPADGTSMHMITYGDSEVQIEVCKECKGIWLDKGEFDKIIAYVKEQADRDVVSNYGARLAEEAAEVFTGPEGVRSELADLTVLLSLFKYKFVIEHPNLSVVFTNLPR